MTTQESSLATATEELFIQFFATNPDLAEYPAKHYSEDDEAETPDIMVKVVVNKHLDSISLKANRLYKAEIEIKIRANMAKDDVGGFDETASIMEEMIDNLSDYAVTLAALPIYSFFSMICTFDMDGGNERDDDEKRRQRCRKLALLVQEKT